MDSRNILLLVQVRSSISFDGVSKFFAPRQKYDAELFFIDKEKFKTNNENFSFILNHNIFDHNDAPTLNNMQQVSGQNNNNNNTNNNVETNNKKRSIMQEYLSKLQELHKGGLLTEHQRKKLKEGILLQANGVKEQINEKYELLEIIG